MWVAAWLAGHLARRGALQAGDAAEELEGHRRALVIAHVQHAAALAAWGSGAWLMRERGWGIGYPGWLAVKVGLTVFLLVPLEALHAWACHLWIAPGLVEVAGGAASKRLARGLGIEQMVRSLALPLLGVAVPLMAWLSLARPF